PINPAVVEALGVLYAHLAAVAQQAQEIEPLFRRVHATDLRRGETPRAGEAAWNVPGGAPHGSIARAAIGAPSVSSDLAAIATSPSATTTRTYAGQPAVTELVTTTDGRRALHKTPRPHEDPGDSRFILDGEELVPLVAQAIGAPVARVHRDAPDSV